MVARAGGCVLHYVPMLAFIAVVSAMGGAAIAGAPIDGSIARHQRELMARRLDRLMASLSSANAPSPSAPPPISQSDSCVYHVTAYGADPSGKTDSAQAISRTISAASTFRSSRSLTGGIADLGGVQVHLDGGTYLISSPLVLPAGVGNIKIHSGTLQASDDFPADRYLIELWAAHGSSDATSSSSSYSYEYVTLRDLMLDANYRGGGVAIVDALRTSIDNCYVTHFTSDGISVRSGHETFIRSTFIGQHMTAGSDPGEKNFTGTGINLMGNDNAVTDVVIFSAAVGILVSGQANVLTGVHCYNKATGWGGTGIYLKLPGLSQTRIVNCYMDYTGIVSEDPVMLHISGSFFLGDANVVLKSVNGAMKGVEIVDNLFSGSGGSKNIVELDESNAKFADVDQVYVQRNSVKDMTLRSTAAAATVSGNRSVWTVDFSPVLLLPDRIGQVQYSMLAVSASVFPNHALRSASGNKVVIESDVAVNGRVYVAVDQNMPIVG